MSKMKDLAIDELNKIHKEDDVWVKFHMRVTEVTSTQIFGFTEDGKCVSAPLDAVVEKFPRLLNTKEKK